MRLRFFASVLLLLTGLGCASARVLDKEADRLFREGKYNESAARLETGYKELGADPDTARDALLYLMDWGLALHTAARYDESNKVFLRADKIAEIKDYTSLATEGATLLTSDNIKQYQGEDFEKVLINTYLAMNYALMGNREDALVEARRVNHKLGLMVSEGKRKYKQSAFARYLSAVLYEMDGDYNAALIDYKNVYDLLPSFPGLGRDLWRTSRAMRMRDEAERWEDVFKLSDEDKKEALRPLKEGELIVIFQNGLGPAKRPNPDFNSLPVYRPRFNPVSQAEVYVDDALKGPTAVLLDIEKTAIENLHEKYAGMIAKKVAGLVAKEVVSRQVEEKTNSKFLGALSWVIMHASDTADLRAWSLLPKDLQMARFVLPEGAHKIRLQLVGGPQLEEKTVEIKPAQKVILNYRFVPR